MFCKIKALAESGRDITLHYFHYKEGRGTKGLEQYCREVHSYPRSSFVNSLLHRQPYIVHSRINAALVKQLNQDKDPVLMEGLHCAGIVPLLNNNNRLIVVRMHNDEAAYYGQLAKASGTSLRKLYFKLESSLLAKYQHNLDKHLTLACISMKDMEALKITYGMKDLHYVPAFTPWQQQTTLEGRGDYCLYHGNLAVPENEQIAEWLIIEVFSKITTPFAIAGKGISKKLESAAKSLSHVSLVSSPSDAELDTLIQNAQINILPSLNSTGLKLKLLHAIFMGRHCVTNLAGVDGTEFTNAVTLCNTADDYVKAITRLMEQSFSKEEEIKRIAVSETYNNALNAAKLNALL